MLALKYFLMILGLGLFGSTGALMAYDIYVSEQLRHLVVGRGSKTTGMKSGKTVHGPFRAPSRRAA